jgi:hypothetical protein
VKEYTERLMFGCWRWAVSDTDEDGMLNPVGCGYCWTRRGAERVARRFREDWAAWVESIDWEQCPCGCDIPMSDERYYAAHGGK